MFLESGPFKFSKILTFHYIDDIVLMYPQNDLKIMDKLNKIEPTRSFTYELETNNLTFWNILLMNNNKIEFKIHLKSTNKNEHMSFYSHHNTKIKSGIIIGFYL